MNKNKEENAVRNVFYVIFTIVLIVILIICIKNSSTNSSSESSVVENEVTTGDVKSTGGYFSLYFPEDYSFVNYSYSSTNSDLSKYDADKDIFIAGYTYSLTEDDESFKEYVDGFWTNYSDNDDIDNLSEVESIEISDYEAYTYTYNYTYSNDTYYYAREIFIHGAFHDYVIYYEIPNDTKDEYEEDVLAMVQAFIEYEV